MRQLFVFASLLLFASACSGPAPDSNQTVGNEPQESSASSDALVLDLGAMMVDLPESWSQRTPSSSMRLAEAEIPGPDGPAVLSVFFFGAGGGGNVEANLQRWIGQVELDAGSQPIRNQFAQGAFSISTVEAVGTLRPSTMGAGPTEPLPGSMLLGAVIEGDGGPWFFKITGPESTVSAAKPAFNTMLRSAHTPS